MTTTAKSPARVKPARIARLMQVGAAQVLALTAGHNVTFYRLTPLDPCFGQAAFRLAKADRGNGPEPVYDVLIDGARSSCECLGFLKHRHCKHVEGLEELIARGKLASRQVEKPAPATCLEPRCPRVAVNGGLCEIHQWI